MAGQRERFGEQLRVYREAAGYSQEELAERAGLSANAVGALERSERKRPYPDTIRRLAEALGLSDDARSAFAAASRAGGSAAFEPAGGPKLRARAMGELPGEPTPLIGRDREVEVVRQLLQQAEGRLLTLTGPGGVGKTRLALHVARSMADHYPDGVVWVELAPLGDPALVLPTIAHTLGVKERLGGTPVDALYAHLRERRALMVLDNMEHLLDVAPDMAALLHACPDLQILTTSRAPLGIRGEQEYVVPPLELPPAGTGPPLREMEHSPSVALFIQRARQANSTFALTSANALAIAAICRRLDGLPLALELAAARVRALGPTDLLARLDRLMPLLVGGSRDLPQR
ncbi:MAG: helix-turn-helix domain-containing protein [Chloroflexota bacterium]|nr:helix-turn-helix domain-containing protein [Chloroflexota bacterium]